MATVILGPFIISRKISVVSLVLPVCLYTSMGRCGRKIVLPPKCVHVSKMLCLNLSFAYPHYLLQSDSNGLIFLLRPWSLSIPFVKVTSQNGQRGSLVMHCWYLLRMIHLSEFGER